ncbi:MAG: ABC transporter permease [Parachlamydiaceae bacterium]|nr:ABC transporter permease [Parachlamydiaceae bacterium]
MKEVVRAYSYWRVVWKQFKQHYLGMFALFIVFIFCLMGIYAPFLASSKPFVVYFDGEWYFPLFRYLFYRGFFTKRLDLFYNLLIFTFPLFVIAWVVLKNNHYWRKLAIIFILIAQSLLFVFFAFRPQQDPATNSLLNQERQNKLQMTLVLEKKYPLFATPHLPNWQSELDFLSPYAKLNMVLRYQHRKEQMEHLKPYDKAYMDGRIEQGLSKVHMPILWYLDEKHIEEQLALQNEIMITNQQDYDKLKPFVNGITSYCQDNTKIDKTFPAWLKCDFLNFLPKNVLNEILNAKQSVSTYEIAQAQYNYLKQKEMWLEQQSGKLKFQVMPLLRPFHWEDDAGGSQELNQYLPWWELTRINRKDLVSALIFGVRISLSVGLTAVGLALLIGIPIGAVSGYYGGKIDIATYRLIEIWESMPTFFMLLMVVAFLQSKSIFIVISVIGLFGWTNFSRFVRGEFFRQKQLPYVEACRALGFNDSYIMFSHLLPNAIPPLLTLVPFAILGAITSEAGLSFLGLGEEGSCSWGVLMDEGRSAFPAESYLLWPPAILLTIFLVSIALVGDSLRDALDPKLHKQL